MVILADEYIEEFKNFLAYHKIEDDFWQITMTLHGGVYNVKLTTDKQIKELYSLRYITYIMIPTGYHV